MQPVVADTGPIIHLDEADALWLLSIFDTVHVPHTVLEELERGSTPDALSECTVETHVVDGDETAYPNLDPGETAAMLLADQLETVVLTDDLAARETATEQEIEVHGSIGVVLAAYSQDELTSNEAKSLLRKLHQDTTLYLAKPLLEHAIRAVTENDNVW
ncbi:hypothetical protein [Natronolimnobius baerhuensis]|uniref:Nucleic acid-binding protein n=1 Tax=Natronolimnobius baerhuensis TaxID=253108 RepID=A0A202E6T0_9EURY|nr:hypothetical protein [Natronolimnobius baerhuensis]OVE83894.1 hypothetical protein B2G88_15910 [Natronolimnobius baerhuensis]